MCENIAKYRYTWPGKDESFLCEKHAAIWKAIANAIGLDLQLIPLDDKELKICAQEEE